MPAKFNAKKMKEIRKRKKLTQECLAERADMSDRQLRAMENGKCSNPYFSTVYRISQALEIPMEDLAVTSEEEESGGDSIS